MPDAAAGAGHTGAGRADGAGDCFPDRDAVDAFVQQALQLNHQSSPVMTSLPPQYLERFDVKPEVV
mgnify:CR=1 FL=1